MALRGTAPGAIVRHRCDNPACVNPAHLLAGGYADNMRDAVARGRLAVGERNGNARLTAEQVKTIRLRYRPEIGETLAAEYGIRPSYLRCIVRGDRWRHLLAA